VPYSAPEYRALIEGAGWLDLSRRGRLCLLGTDREKFLHGQVTNEVLKLRAGEGTYAALVTAKGRVETDLFIFKLAEELLLDFEPGLSSKVSQRLERFIIAEDVQVVDVSPVFGLLSIHGPRAEEVLRRVEFQPPAARLGWSQSGEIYLARNHRFGVPGFDLFAPVEGLSNLASKLEQAGVAKSTEAAAEHLRIENGIPRFGVDFDETNLAPETGMERNAISYAKGCYIGQEVIARIRTYGQVAKALRVLRIPGEGSVPAKGAKLLADGRECGNVTSFVQSERLGGRAGLGYVRKEANEIGRILALESGEAVEVAGLPNGV
jgi:tRNA-modifying protein YgfZ